MGHNNKQSEVNGSRSKMNAFRKLEAELVCDLSDLVNGLRPTRSFQSPISFPFSASKSCLNEQPLEKNRKSLPATPSVH